jgi:hypothetical protein
VGRNAEMISCAVTVRCRFHDPIDVATYQVKQFPPEHGDFTCVNPIWAEDRAATAFGALEEVIKPFFQNILGKLSRTSPFSKNLSRESEIFSINRSEKLCPQDRHILWISGADKEVAFIRTCPASDADIEKKSMRPVSAQTFLHPLQDDLLPVFRELPISFCRLPVSRVREIEIFFVFRYRRVAVGPFSEFDSGFQPTFGGRGIVDLQRLVF